MSKIIIVFKNKLESADTILPICHELYKKKKFIFFCENLQHQEILDQNIFLKDTIKSLGKLIPIKKSTNRFINYFYSIYFIIILFFELMNNSKIIHFGKIDIWPFNLLNYFFSKNIIFSQSSSYYDERMKLKSKIYNIKISRKTDSGNIITFNKNFLNEFENIKNKKIILCEAPRLTKNWVNHINKNSGLYLSKFHKNIKPNEKYIVLPISSLNIEKFLDNKFYSKILLKMIISLNKFFPNTKIFIKPHPTTKNKELNKLIFNKKLKNLEVTYLNPNLLCSKAIFFITEIFGTPMIDAKKMGIKTIEFTKYNKATLKATKNLSIGGEHIDIFINYQTHSLDEALKKKFKRNKVFFSKNNKNLTKFLLR